MAIRENEERAQMLGYNTWYFKLVALTVSSFTAVAAGFLLRFTNWDCQPERGQSWVDSRSLAHYSDRWVGTLSGAIVGAAIFRLLNII